MLSSNVKEAPLIYQSTLEIMTILEGDLERTETVILRLLLADLFQTVTAASMQDPNVD